MSFLVTVIIPTYNGADKIEVLLKALQRQTHAPEEVIVVIDGSKDNTLEVLKKFEVKLPSLKIVSQQNKGRAAARNAAAHLSAHDLLVFFDDDMEPDPQCIGKHLDFHKSTKLDCLLCGNIEEPVSTQNSDIQNYKSLLGRRWIDKFPPGATTLRFDNLFFTSANCSVKREVLSQLQMFDERLLDAEDHDLAYRALEAGIPVIFDKDNRAIHHERITCKSYIVRLRSYRVAHEKLKILYPNRLEIRLGSSPGFLKRCAYGLFAWSFFVRWIDEGNLKFLPKKMRYGIYTFVIHSLANVFPDVPL